MYHSINVLKEIDDQTTFYHRTEGYNDLEHGRHLTLLIEKCGHHITHSASLRALIDINFEKTKVFFKL